MTEQNLNELSHDLRELERDFKKKIEPYRSELWRYCYHLTGSPWDAEDLVQDTLLKSLSMLAKVFQPVHTKAYLFKIASNLWIDQTRKKKAAVTPIENVTLQDESMSHNFHVMEHVEILVEQLTPTQFVTLILGDVFLYRGKEIATIIGSSEQAVHTNLHRARHIMKQSQVELDGGEKKQPKPNLTPSPVVKTILQGFRTKDPERIASVLDENLVTDIVHSGYEIGLNETKKNSLNDWKEVVDAQLDIVVDYIELWGLPVIVEMERKQDQQLYLNNVHYMEVTDDHVTYWKFFCFSWDLMNKTAEELDVQLNAEYFYHIF
ncbi:RNA polymerase sigma factor [Thalassobacillus sp. CUG 92003]|uniref:RNA polymerase sigma factor n=1 Tax=Thalassobacillus sp. CUG 92003 TaxID=2736641 RepID=UPI0015E66CEF|nr:RNA polymerase sigma factor [Thalassobacillus sp. CUG 92003]